jgi:uncharacterized cupredoxin-like copper-binding protein
MLRLSILATLTSIALTLPSVGFPAVAQILDPAAHNLVRLEPLKLGLDGDSTKMSPLEYRLKVGQGYRWKIQASDLTEYAFVAPAFIRNIWVRKIEVGDPAVEIKAVTLDELEFENGGEAEVFFVAIRPGTYEFGSKGLMERGMVGKIVVESADVAATDRKSDASIGKKTNNSAEKKSDEDGEGDDN